MTPESKICIDCERPKPDADYALNANMTDGRNNICKSCVNDRIAAKKAKKAEISGLMGSWL